MNIMRRTAVGFYCLLLTLVAQPANAIEPPAENPGSEGDGAFTTGPEYKIERMLAAGVV